MNRMDTKKWLGFFPKQLSKEQNSGTGMAAVLIFIYLGLWTKAFIYFKISFVLLLINMVLPSIFYPLAIVWFGFSEILGTVMSKVVLTVIYMLLVLPVGIIRKWMGKDTLKLTNWKKGNESVMKTRNYTYLPADLEQPY